jgi:hypothetical protein
VVKRKVALVKFPPQGKTARVVNATLCSLVLRRAASNLPPCSTHLRWTPLATSTRQSPSLEESAAASQQIKRPAQSRLRAAKAPNSYCA